jgi:hypothetical protein
VNELSALLERELSPGLLEVVEELDLRQRQVERANGLEQVGIAVLVEIDDESVEVAAETDVG